MYKQGIKRLQIDLVSSCNAACMACSRQSDRDSPNPHFPANLHLSLESFAKVISSPAVSALEEVFFCGNYGDPLASPRLIEFLDLLPERFPRIRWNIHTNGSLGSADTWRALGNRSRESGRLVKFSLDGLADTNGIYRRGVSWERVMNNAAAFIGAGGRAVWKFIRFRHNAHQIEEARNLSREMGFFRFELRENYAPEIEPFLAEGLPEEFRRKMECPEPPFPDGEFGEIRCKSVSESTVYLDHSGHLWPCCWVADWKYSPSSWKRRWQQEKLEQIYGRDFNSLARHSPSEILDGPWFRNDLPASWRNPAGSHRECNVNCGTCS